jgi:hypothetical protein
MRSYAPLQLHLIEYDPDEPWIVRSTGRDSVELPDDQDFNEWAKAKWPSPRYVVKLDREPFRWAGSYADD